MLQFDEAISSTVRTDGKSPRPPAAPARGPLSAAQLEQMHRYWSAANYLTIGQIYLQGNPLLREPLRPEHIKPRLLGHWGTSPSLSFIYVHLNRLIKEQDADMIYLAGPGHGGPALVANAYLEGTYSEIYPEVSQDGVGMRHLFWQFSTPGGIPSHVSVTTPGSIHEGGELGYVLAHAFGGAFDNPDLVVAALVGMSGAAFTLLTKSWAAEFGPSGVNVNAIAPGFTRPPGTTTQGLELEQLARTIPARRVADPTELVGAAVYLASDEAIYLASDEASYVHGATLPVDGGGSAI